MMKKNLLLISLLSIITLITSVLYMNGLNGPFMLDDQSNINPTKITEFDLSKIIDIVFNNSSGRFGRPIPILSFVITSLLHGTATWGYKYHNLIIHITCGISIAILLLKLNSLSNDKNKLPILGTIFIVSLWLLHPLNVSTTLYAVQRMTQLSVLFTLISLTVFLYGWGTGTIFKKCLFYFILFPIFSLSALFSKENAALIPFYILILYVFLSKQATQSSIKEQKRIDQGFFIIVSVIPILLAIIYTTLNFDRLTNYSARSFDLNDRLFTQINVVFFYIKQIVFPRLQEMGIYLDDFEIIRNLSIALSIKFLALIIFLAIGVKYLLKGRYIGLGICLFFAGHLMESTFIPLEMVFEHRNYLPMIGLSIFLFSLLDHIKSDRVKSVSLACYLAVIAGLLSLRVNFWENENTWLKTHVAFHPNSERTAIAHLSHIGKSKITYSELLEEIDKKIKNLPQTISLKAIYLTETCRNQNSYSRALFEELEASSKTTNITVVGYNYLQILVEHYLRNSCKNFSQSELKEVVENYYQRQGKKRSRLTAPLHNLLGKFAEADKEYVTASKHYYSAFKSSKNHQYLYLTISMLLADKSDQSKEAAKEMIKKLTGGEYFNTHLHEASIKDFIEKVHKSNLLN